MQARIQSAVSVVAGAGAAIATQVGQLWLWQSSRAWLTARGGSVEIITPPVPSASFLVSALVAGWVAARLAPTRPVWHGVSAALLPMLLVLAWRGVTTGAGPEWPPFLERLAFLAAGAGLGATLHVLTARPRSARAAG